jgi:hypothetical protein
MDVQPRPPRRWRRRLIKLGIYILVGLLLYHSSPGLPNEAVATIDNPDSFELLSIKPYYHTKESEPKIHGYGVVGQTRIDDPAIRRRLRWALKLGVRQHAMAYACFAPHHAIRVTKDKTVTDFIICFDCHQVQVYIDGRQITTCNTSGVFESVFDKALSKAGVPLGTRGH